MPLGGARIVYADMKNPYRIAVGEEQKRRRGDLEIIFIFERSHGLLLSSISKNFEIFPCQLKEEMYQYA
jgi:hypothetical protein